MEKGAGGAKRTSPHRPACEPISSTRRIAEATAQHERRTRRAGIKKGHFLEHRNTEIRDRKGTRRAGVAAPLVRKPGHCKGKRGKLGGRSDANDVRKNEVPLKETPVSKKERICFGGG